MIASVKNKLTLLVVFYKSTLLLSAITSTLMAVLAIFNIQNMLLLFGICFLSGGTVITLMHKEISKQHEYYFYYNKGIAKLPLLLTCILANLFIGIIIIIISNYV
jgi:hypothetical protein